MKWTVKLIAEGRSSVGHEVITIERGESISPGTIGLGIAEAKVILEGLQRHVVARQVQDHNCPAALFAMRQSVSKQGLLSIHTPQRLWQCSSACAPREGLPCTGSQNHSYSVLFTNKYPVTPELKYLTAKMAALMPFGKAADFLSELLPMLAEVSASTVRNRTMRVGRRLQKSAEALVKASVTTPCKEAGSGWTVATFGLDIGGRNGILRLWPGRCLGAD